MGLEVSQESDGHNHYIAGGHLNVLLSTTIGWNKGDDIIRLGCLRLFEAVCGSDHNYLVYNRSPGLNDSQLADYFVDPKGIDLVLFCGTPEWYGSTLRPVYRLLHETNTPAIYLGIGSPFPNHLSEVEKAVVRKSLVIARDRLTAEETGGHLLPCPALFAGVPVAGERRKKRAYIVQNHEILNQSVSKRLVDDFRATYKEGDLIAHYKNEFSWLRTLGPTFYDFRPERYLERYAEYAEVVSTRLHGAIGALSVGSPAALVADKDNLRITGAREPFAEVLPLVHHFKDVSGFATSEQINAFRERTWERYMEVVK
jgi:hypothetical protein